MPQPASSPAATQDVLAGGGEMGARMRDIDWAKTPLGPVEQWPQSLKTCVRIVLTSRQPMFVWWGDDLINLYNDAYKTIVGGKHPGALGQPASVVWHEIWRDVGPRAESAMKRNEGTYDEALLLIMERYGYQEETYYTFSYSPVPNDHGGTGGIICSNTDDTQRIIGERQLGLLRELAASTVNARTVKNVCEQSVGALRSNGWDLPFALIYLADEKHEQLVLTGASGIEPGLPGTPAMISLKEKVGPWPVIEVIKHHVAQVVPITILHGTLPMGAWEVPPKVAAVLPVVAAGESGQTGVLIVALNPFRQYDEGYEGFIKLVAGQISASVASALAYEEEKKRAEALAELDRAKTAFFSNVSHEFRTPLTLMLGPLEDTLQQPEEAMSEATREELKVVHRNSLRLLKLVNALLDFSRIEAGRIQATFEPVDLAKLTNELANSFRSAVEKAGMLLEVDCASLSHPAYVDREMWEKIVLNLISNAFKHTFTGGIRVTLREGPVGIQFSVQDSGTGIPADAMPRLFERFFRVEGAASRTHEGSGIGLSLVKDLVQLHGGIIEVKSTEGRGSTFVVTLPDGHAHLPQERVSSRRPVSPAPRQSHSYVEEAMRWLGPESEVRSRDAMPSAQHGEPKRELPRVVVADDNADMRDYLRHLLSGSYRVETVENGNAALAAVRREPPDVVLTDIMMPGLDGFGLLKALRSDSQTQDIPIIMLSARAGEEARVEGIDAGADDYLVKPFGARELLARVAANLRLVRLRRENAARVENILESTSDAFLAVDSEWRITYSNRNYRNMVHRSGELESWLVGQNLWEQHPGLEDSEAGERYRASMASQEADSFEMYDEPLQMFMEVRLFPSPEMLSIYLRDITQRRLTEEALHDARDRLDATLNAAEIGTWTWDIEHNEVLADQNMGKLFSMDSVEQGEPVESFLRAVHPDDAARVHQDIEDVLSGAKPDFECDYRLVQRDGSLRWVTARGQVQRNEQGVPVRFPGVILDITARKEAEQALRTSELRFRAIFNQASTFIGIISPEGVLLDGNDIAFTAGGVTREGTVGLPFWETAWWNRDAGVQDRIRKSLEVAARGETTHFQTPFFPGTGEQRWTDIHVTPVTDGGRIAFILLEGRDITELIETRKAEAAARDIAERASQAKDDFLASLSHELRTPLNPVLLLATEAAVNRSFPQAARQDFDTIAKNVQLEARLIDDLLDLTLITRGKMAMDIGVRDAHVILRDALSTVHMELDQKAIELNMQLVAEHHGVWGDPVRLQQIFWNVLKNAVKFTTRGGKITVTTTNVGPDQELLIEIRDNGIGMTEPELGRVFDYFSQGEHAERGGSHRFGGLGLGLAISKMLVELHSGAIHASSPGRDQGTTISIKLATARVNDPETVATSEAHREPAFVAAPEAEDTATTPLRVLLVEDHEPTRVALAQLLKRRKYEVTTAGTVTEALKAAANKPLDLVVSDIGLPDGNGNDLMRQLRASYGLRGIALTGYGMSDDVTRTQAAGFIAHLTKPISVQSLDQALRAARTTVG